MNDMFTFEPAAWELLCDSLKRGSVLSAVRLLSVTASEDEAVMEDIFRTLLDKGVTLDVSQLPPDYASGQQEVRLRFEESIAGGDLVSSLEEGDPLRLYLEELASIPAQGDPGLLSQRLLEGDDDSAKKLTDLLLYRAVDAAKACTGRGVLLLDLIQEASLGLWQGILNYEGGDVEKHVDWWIDQSLARVIILQARQSGLLRSMSEAMEAYRRADRTLLDRLGRSATLEEISMEMGVTPQQAELARDMLEQAKDMEALKTPSQPEEEEEQAVEDTAYFQSRQRVNELMSALDEKEALVLKLRFGLDGDKPMTPQAVGAKLGMGADAVVAMEAAALAKLRN